MISECSANLLGWPGEIASSLTLPAMTSRGSLPAEGVAIPSENSPSEIASALACLATTQEGTIASRRQSEPIDK